MRHHRAIAIAAAAVLALMAAACGDDEAATTTAAPVSSTTTTTTAPTTSAAPTTTTLAGDQHPAWGVSWAAIWPPEGSTAIYRVQIMGSETMDLATHFEYGVEWRGGTWDRLVIGTLEPGQYGAALYFSRPEPWVLRLWGVAQTAPDREDTVFEYFEVPQDLDFTLLPDNPPTLEGNMLVEHGLGISDPIPAIFRMEWVGIEDVTVAAGAFAGAYHLRFGLGADFYGVLPGAEITSFSDLWLHPEHLIVKWAPGPAGGPIELAVPWAAPEGG